MTADSRTLYHVIFVHNTRSTDVDWEMLEIHAHSDDEAKALARTIDLNDSVNADRIFVVHDSALMPVPKGPVEASESRNDCAGIGSDACSVGGA